MGRKDTVTKVYMEQNNIFADAFNYYIFGGQQVIRPEQLKALDVTELAVPYGADSAGEPEQKYRDVMKSLTAMYDGQAALVSGAGLSGASDNPAGLSDEELDKFHTTLREVLAFIKYSKDMEMLDKTVNGNFRNLRKNEIDVLNQCVNAKLSLEEGEEELVVCKALEDMKKKTTETTHLEDIKNVMEAFHVSAEQAMKALKIPESESPRFLSML